MTTRYVFLLIVFSSTIGFFGCKDKEKALPTAKNVTITLGESSAFGNYTFSDDDQDKEGESTFRWYRSDDSNGTNETKIPFATEKTYPYSSSDDGKYLTFKVTPIQKDDVSGTAVRSSPAGPVKTPSKDLITLYSVSGNGITKKQDNKVVSELKPLQEDTKKHQELWAQVLKVVPASYLKKINQFVIFAGKTEKTLFSQTLGYVVPTRADLSTWEIGLAIDFAYATDFNDANNGVNGTIVHEFGHIITSDSSQLDAPIEKDACNTYHKYSACAKKDSYIYPFYSNYWKNIPTDNSATENYKAAPNDYVTEYAATDVGEDLAEVFRFLVLGSIPTDNSIVKNQKIIELNGYSALRDLRTFVRNNLESASFLPRRKGEKSLGNFKGCGTHRMMEEFKQQQ